MVLNLNNWAFKPASQFLSQFCGGEFWVKITRYNLDLAVSQFCQMLYRVFHETEGLQILYVTYVLRNERPILCQDAGGDVEFSANRQDAAVRNKFCLNGFGSVPS
jgi:hypothetical protein